MATERDLGIALEKEYAPHVPQWGPYYSVGGGMDRILDAANGDVSKAVAAIMGQFAAFGGAGAYMKSHGDDSPIINNLLYGSPFQQPLPPPVFTFDEDVIMDRARHGERADGSIVTNDPTVLAKSAHLFMAILNQSDDIYRLIPTFAADGKHPDARRLLKIGPALDKHLLEVLCFYGEIHAPQSGSFIVNVANFRQLEQYVAQSMDVVGYIRQQASLMAAFTVS